MAMNSDEILKNMKILYVEDDEETREELADVLKRRAGKVFTGGNGRRGQEYLFCESLQRNTGIFLKCPDNLFVNAVGFFHAKHSFK